MATAPTRTDAELVRRLQAREREAWEELYAEYQPRLRAFGYRLAGNAHDADDLAHETFVRALPALDRLDPETTDLGAYLFATAKNLFLKQVERAKRAEPTADVPEPDIPTAIEDDPERSALLARQQEEVRIANGRLDPRQRLVLALCELEDRSYAEIGELVGLNENAVAQLVFRARERLRTELRLVQVDPDSLPAECRAFLPLLAQHLDAKLRSPKLEQTLAHLEECERCQSALADMREAKRRYRALFLPPLSTEDARAAVEDDLERVGYWRGPARRPLLRRPRGIAAVIAVAVAAALCLAGGLGAAALLVDRSASEAARTTVPLPTTSAEVTETAPTTTPPPSTEATAPPATATAGAEPPSTAAPPTTTETAPESESQPAAPPPPTTAAKPKPDPKPEPAPPVSTQQPKVVPPPPPPKDTRSPTMTITSAPAASTSATSASFSFSADEPQVTFACRLDAGAWEPCASPRTLTALALGPHAFEVRGTDRAGNVGAPASRRWTVTPPPDTTPPTVTLTQVPPATTTSRTASFAFAASEPGATVACSYDSGPFVACTSPHTIADAGVDDHTFAVRATDTAGNTGSPAVAQWTVVAPLPDLVAVLTDTTVTVRNVGQGPAGQSLVTVLGVGTFTIPTLAPGQSTTHKYACVRGTITATADYARVVAESNEDNNTTTRRVSCLGLVG